MFCRERDSAGQLTVVRENIVCMMSRDVNTVITRGKAGAGPGMGDLWPCRSWSGIRREERWGMMLNNPFIMQHPPGSDNKRTQFGAWRAPLLPPLSPGWKSFFIWKTNIYFRNARSESLHQSPLPRLETERQCCNDNKPQSDPGQDLWSFLHLICNFQRVIITSLRALYTSIWELIGMLWSYD